ncbi:LamG-like jellyroll fold domain-containing protein [Salinimicrobium oceani]|uniref:LamG domain-containing protein n=1 Tax=Salinimicrobium oceani TaxID=2722702 RepID=A0ABX1D164_9FLAO|nr:LamG-like jellyroll fold domain-containing protein [Salinimicrobium oceani]NJW54090.1 LamG domain-containing protein [Salinimicrobium oceani]
MKNYNRIFLGILAVLFIMTGCEREGIDPITKVDPGADQGAPEVNIKYPQQGTVINEAVELSTITIDLEVEDDIELQEIVVMVNGEEVATFTEFTDYRIALKKVIFEGLPIGEHTVTVRATDMDGNETVQTVNFTKEPPYSPKFENEIFYMPFNKDFMELVGLQTPAQIGSPGFSDDAQEGTGAYKGAADSYLSIPMADLGNEFTVAFWYKLDPSVGRAGIITATDDSDLNQGFRLFREASGPDAQVLKLNLGTGEDSAWNDGGKISSVEPEWTHITLTVSPSGTAIYFNGVLERATVLNNVPVDWTGVENLVIGSGLNFNGWGHHSDPSLIDELRIFDAALTAEEVSLMVNPPSEDLSLYLPFEGDYTEQISGRNITVVGSPGFAGEAKAGTDAYAGADGAYLTFPSSGLLGDEFTTTFWYKVNSTPDRAGIISISAVNEAGPNMNNLTKGFQLFREGSADSQRIKASVGTGAGNSWNDGGLIDVTAGEWVHIAFVITENKSRIYLNGELATEANVAGGVDWTGADLVSVMSGAPRFVEWNHLSDRSYVDDLRFYRVALTEEEIEANMAK